jgi:DNA polymerase-3 subunit epsilon
MSWLNHSLFFIDFEGNKNSGVLEYGVVEIFNGNIVDTKTRLCRPRVSIQISEAEVHGLNNKMCENEAYFSEDWEYFSSIRERGYFVSHFSGSENALLKATWPYTRKSFDVLEQKASHHEWGPWIDTARLYAQFYPTFNSAKLEDLVKAAGLQTTLSELAFKYCPLNRQGYHCALYDALAGALLLNALGKISAVAQMSLAQIITLSTQNVDKRTDFVQRQFEL